MPQVLDDGDFRYVYGLGRIAEVDGSDNAYYYLPDGLGSTMALTDDSGTVENTYAYDPFGALTSSSGSQANAFTFTGEQTDGSTSLEYLRARYYDPETGRFLSRDPLSSSPFWAQHAYTYAGSNPTSFINPYGLCLLGFFPGSCGDALQYGLKLASKEGKGFLEFLRSQIHRPKIDTLKNIANDFGCALPPFSETCIAGLQPTDLINWDCAGFSVDVVGLILQSLVPVGGSVIDMTFIDPIGYTIDASQNDRLGLAFDAIGTAGTLIAILPGVGQGVGAAFDIVSSSYGGFSCVARAAGR